ncbi:MAG: hypothetical protein OMM_00439 [Candidatus Magnetoglobus multicellularis str. Araruama]|uniref:DUF1573 domain-containing protein n=1 Tax=Candidatus Magnetoglobus multicellularis str. Araruama TaxID=890399 RepID=A0A1V1PGU8_9BACT|nr:MAG: hypothetical protein OMM_00439 [Candidatus Magnetoglobus multicellularis str. Araruama]
MNIIKSVLYILSVLLLVGVTHATEPPLFPDTSLFESGEFTKALPIIACDAGVFQFSQVLEGTIVKHTFEIQNRGDAILQILKVKTGCGCSTASYDNEILPGKTGKITLNIDTNGYGGKLYTDIIHVISNDSSTPDFILKASGPVDILATVTPKGISFKGKCSDSHEAIVTIEPNPKYRCEITGFDLAELKGKITCNLKKQNQMYLLTVRNQIKTPGRYWGKIVLNTNNEKHKNLICGFQQY